MPGRLGARSPLKGLLARGGRLSLALCISAIRASMSLSLRLWYDIAAAACCARPRLRLMSMSSRGVHHARGCSLFANLCTVLDGRIEARRGRRRISVFLIRSPRSHG